MKKKVLATSLMTAVLSAAMLAGTVNAENAEPTPVTLVLYGEESARMTEFAENELHEKVMEEINVDLTIQYLPWSEYAAGKTELMLSSGEKFVTYTDTAFLAKCVAKGYYEILQMYIRKTQNIFWSIVVEKRHLIHGK